MPVSPSSQEIKSAGTDLFRAISNDHLIGARHDGSSTPTLPLGFPTTGGPKELTSESSLSHESGVCSSSNYFHMSQ